MEVTELLADVPPEAVIHELVKDADNAMKVDCADPKVEFVVPGWFVFPKGSLVRSPDLKHGA